MIFSIFATFCCSQGFSKNQWWHYVALCGAMWRYVALSRNLKKTMISSIFATFCCFQGFSRKQWWRYVALCGAIPYFEKTMIFSMFAVLLFPGIFKKTVVALCGAILEIEKKQQVFPILDIFKTSPKTAVVLCGPM